ncbi:hypothetical protein LMG29542_03389 [Paraburkholderia humisilvae]|uniref:Uncharacterized protein n=1 Tax=Paraburkholderia humisilvae TaxID=627669 RepID=A0A6J5DXA4_9BURK|nr:hypothetical protein LMG29542_03389 [Paraburkholderia humisilvae]
MAGSGCGALAGFGALAALAALADLPGFAVRLIELVVSIDESTLAKQKKRHAGNGGNVVLCPALTESPGGFVLLHPAIHRPASAAIATRVLKGRVRMITSS